MIRIGPLQIERVRTRTRAVDPVEAGEYADHTVCQVDPKTGFELPPGMRCIPGKGPRPAWAGEPPSAEWFRERTRPPRTDDVEDSIRAMREIAGSISIGRRPVKADYRARVRYCNEEFDEHGDPL